MTPPDHPLDHPLARRGGALLLALVLAGCATQTPYTRPAAQAPAQWEQAGAATAAVSTERWWLQFGDPVLDRLMAEVLARNNDLASAALRVRQAQLQARLAGTALAPTFSGSLSSRSSRALDGGGSATSSGASLSASYEVDLWGRLSSARDAADWEARATAQDRASAALALTATTAGLYWQLGYLNERLAAARQSLAYAERTLELVRAQYRAGAVSALEVREAEQTLTSQQAALTQLQQQQVEARNALAILLDGPPGAATLAAALPQEPGTLPANPLPEVGAGLPAELLARRPDLAAAELRLRSVLASGDASRASYYPALTLTGSLGTSSTALLGLLSNPVAALGAGLTLPFLRMNEMKIDRELTQAQYEEAVVNFRQTLYQALADTENALSARTQYLRQGELLLQQLASAREAERLYEVRYRAGSTPLRSWLDAQERRRSAELALAENRLNQSNALATLYKALGGTTGQEANVASTAAAATGR